MRVRAQASDVVVLRDSVDRIGDQRLEERVMARARCTWAAAALVAEPGQRNGTHSAAPRG